MPNLLSLVRLPLGAAVAALLLLRDPATNLAATLLFVLAALTDYLDGFLARRFGMVSTLGKWLDALCDALFFACVYAAFLALSLMPPMLFALFLLRETTQYAVIRPLTAARGIDPGARIAGKVKTVLQSAGSAAILILRHLSLRGRLDADALRSASLWILAVLVGVSLTSLAWYVVPLMRTRHHD